MKKRERRDKTNRVENHIFYVSLRIRKNIMRKLFTAILLAFSVVSFAQDKQGKCFTDQFDVYSNKYAQEIVNFMSHKKFKGREAGTKENRKIMEYIVAEFQKAGCPVERQEISATSLAAVIGEPKPGKTYPEAMTNVIARIEGKDPHKLIVVGAHYDHLGNKKGIGIHPGADDNASGIVALLSLARMVKASGITPECTILFCAWDGEEKGLLGSKYFVGDWYAKREPNDTICRYMNFDMVGRTADPANPAVTFAWNDNYPFLRTQCDSAATKIVQPFTILYDQRFGDGKGGSDYAPFSAHNIPFVAWMEDEMHADYHKPTDTPDKIHWIKLRKTILLSYGVLWQWMR